MNNCTYNTTAILGVAAIQVDARRTKHLHVRTRLGQRTTVDRRRYFGHFAISLWRAHRIGLGARQTPSVRLHSAVLFLYVRTHLAVLLLAALVRPIGHVVLGIVFDEGVRR